jgi:hypothetical protein
VDLAGTGYALTANSGTLRGATSGPFTLFIPSFTLTVRGGGTGSGVVVEGSTSAAIDCVITNGIEASEGCSADYELDTRVVLRAVTSGDDEFDGWSGAGCSGRELCTVTMDQAQEVVATFTRRFVLTVQGDPDGSGAGTVSSDDDQINCSIVNSEASGTCQGSYPVGTLVDLTPTPTAPSTFGGWSGCQVAIRTDHCFVTMDQIRTVTARFIEAQIP